MKEIKQEKVAALYARFSKDEDAESNSIKSQKEILVRYAKENGYCNYKIYADDGFTGTNFERPDFKKMIEDIEDGCVGAVVVKDYSRLGRNYLGCGIYTEMIFPEYDVRFISINDNVDTLKCEDDFAPFRNLMNEWYSRDISKKQRAALQNKGKSGKRLIGGSIYGYKKIDNGNWSIDEPAAKIVKLIYKLCLDGKGPQQIANILREKEIKTPLAYKKRLSEKIRQNPYSWTPQTISEILERREYCGDTVNFKTHKPSFKSRKIVYHDKSDYMIFTDTHEAIISRDDFAAVQKIRSERRRIEPMKDRALFSGMLYCCDCKSKMYSNRTRNTIHQNCYICSKYRKKPKECTSHYVRDDKLTEFILELINSLIAHNINDPKALTSKLKKCILSETHREKEKSQKSIAEYSYRLDEINRIIKSLYEDKLNGKIPGEIFINLSKQYADEQKDLNDKIFVVSKSIGAIKKQETEINQFLAAINKYDKVFTELTPNIIKEFIERIEVHSKEIIDGVPQRQIDIYLRGIGFIDINEFLGVLPLII